MNARALSFAITAAISVLSIAGLCAQSYLSQMPTVERVEAEVKGSDEIDTAARQYVAFFLLGDVVKTLARSRDESQALTPNETRQIDQYAAAQRRHLIDPVPERRWTLQGRYLQDWVFHDELLQRFFSDELRAAIYQASGTQPPAARPSSKQDSCLRTSAPELIMAGDVYYDAKDYTKAINSYKSSIATCPTSGAYQRLGNAYVALKRHSEAVLAYREAIRLNPDNDLSYEGLGVAYHALKQYREALKAFSEAVRLKPGEGRHHDSMGNVYFDLTQYPDALRAFQQAVRLKPNEAAFRVDLGCTYVKLGQLDEARKIYQALLSADKEQAQLVRECVLYLH